MMEKRNFLAVTLLLIVLIGLFSQVMMPVSAANVTLSLNSGSANVRWFVTGESSLVMNGFDLDILKVTRPTQVNQISINVIKAASPVEAVVYQDANGGSPTDARLVGRKSVSVSTTGVVTVTFDTPLTVSDRFLWVGFYLPVGFEFAADASGTSGLTYWGWTPGSTFDLANLATASVLGPSDGSAPVNLNLNGIARITAGVITSDATGASTSVPGATLVATAVGQQQGDAGTNLSPLTGYSGCTTLLYDRDDVTITYQNSVSFFCQTVPVQLRPKAPAGYNRQGPLYDVYVFGISSGTVPFPYPVTHCIKPSPDEIGRALFGLAYGAPREWQILPTVRFGDYICAEVGYSGFVSYFIPE